MLLFKTMYHVSIEVWLTPIVVRALRDLTPCSSQGVHDIQARYNTTILMIWGRIQRVGFNNLAARSCPWPYYTTHGYIVLREKSTACK